MRYSRTDLLGCLLILLVAVCTCTELTFELPDNSKECFYERIPQNTSVYFEYQVSFGGQMDVDVTMLDPGGVALYDRKRGNFDNYRFVTTKDGPYAACFSNDFSPFSHKYVYFDFQVGKEPSLPGINEHATALTRMDTSAENIHKSLNDILDAQTHHRLREAQGRKRGEELNDHVMWWSCVETAAILFVSIGQILVLRNFFTDRKPSQSQYRRL